MASVDGSTIPWWEQLRVIHNVHRGRFGMNHNAPRGRHPVADITSCISFTGCTWMAPGTDDWTLLLMLDQHPFKMTSTWNIVITGLSGMTTAAVHVILIALIGTVHFTCFNRKVIIRKHFAVMVHQFWHLQMIWHSPCGDFIVDWSIVTRGSIQVSPSPKGTLVAWNWRQAPSQRSIPLEGNQLLIINGWESRMWPSWISRAGWDGFVQGFLTVVQPRRPLGPSRAACLQPANDLMKSSHLHYLGCIHKMETSK